jgi:hypothetical protein
MNYGEMALVRYSNGQFLTAASSQPHVVASAARSSAAHPWSTSPSRRTAAW